MEYIGYVSVFLEVVIALLSLIIALGKKQSYGWGLAFTFFFYVFYDFSSMQGWQISDAVMNLGFLAATISALVSIYSIYKKQN